MGIWAIVLDILEGQDTIRSSLQNAQVGSRRPGVEGPADFTVLLSRPGEGQSSCCAVGSTVSEAGWPHARDTRPGTAVAGYLRFS